MKVDMSALIRLYDLPGQCWPILFDHGHLIDRSNLTINDYLASKGFELCTDPLKADILIRKAELSANRPEFFTQEKQAVDQYGSIPVVYLIGEPRELAPAAYRFADPLTTLAVAPGNTFKRMYFGRPWTDPQLDGWESREDRICWIGRPIEHRIRMAQKIIEAGYSLDIYSRDPWPLPAWKGPAQNDVETARRYKYRVVCENSNQFGYHSEKLFTGLKSGCVNFYWGDPHLELEELKGCYLPLSLHHLKDRMTFAPSILEEMNNFMFSHAWEIYSIRSFIDRILDTVQVGRGQKWSPAPTQEIQP